MRSAASHGKSGQLFFLSQDEMFIIKTISLKEFLVLQKILFQYYKHLMKNSKSYLV